MTGATTHRPDPLARLKPGLYAASARCFLGALCMLFLGAPFVGDSGSATLIEAALLTITLLLGVAAVGGRRRNLVIGLFLAIPALVGKWLSHAAPDLLPPEFYLAATGVFTAYVAALLFRFIARARTVNAEALCAGIASYLLLALCFAVGYMIASRADPGAFSLPPSHPPGATLSGADALYFSVTTITTAGFGDLAPVSPAARGLAVAESVTGVLFLAVFMARLVSAYTPRPRS